MQQKEAITGRGIADAPARGRSWPRRIVADAVTGQRRRQASSRPLALALQGGGSFGAFTWGVLDHLLEDETIALDIVSGASAGAVNAVVLADGLAAGGRAAARAALERVWHRLSNAAPLAPFGQLGQGMAASATTALELSASILSPYQFNPFGLNPLRDILAEEIDFVRLRAVAPVRLLIAATRVRDGRVRLFRDDEITLDAVLASACLPLLHHAVAIDGEWYWDGGYSANPPLRQLVIDAKADDVVLVQLTPGDEDGVPHLSPDIARRLRQIAFNGPLQKELEALDDLAELCKGTGLFRSRFCRKLQRLRLHRIAAAEAVDDLRRASALTLDWPFLTRLKERGRAAAEEWLAGATQGP